MSKAIINNSNDGGGCLLYVGFDIKCCPPVCQLIEQSQTSWEESVCCNYSHYMRKMLRSLPARWVCTRLFPLRRPPALAPF